MIPILLLVLAATANGGARPACPCRSCFPQTSCCNAPASPSYGVCSSAPPCTETCKDCTCNYVGRKGPGNWGTLSCPGGTCSNGLAEGMMCIGKKVCKSIAPSVPCKATPWTDWDACDLSTGTKTRYRYATRKPVNNGTGCPELYETQPCPVDCKVSEWGPWLECGDQSPTNETKVRIRTVTQWPLNGGAPCPLIAEVQNCPIDCVVSDWGPWTGCNNSTGIRTTNRAVLRHPANGGKECQGPYYFEMPCRVDCKVGNWTEWSICGIGKTQYRSREVLYQQNLRGAPCPVLNETQNCTQGCGQQLQVFNCKLDQYQNTTTCREGGLTVTVVNKPTYNYATLSINARLSNYTKTINETLYIPPPQLGPCGYIMGYVVCPVEENAPVTVCNYGGLSFTVPYTPNYVRVLVEIVAKPIAYNRISS